VLDAHAEHEPLLLAVLRDERDPVPNRVAHGIEVNLFAVDEDLSGRDPVGGEYGARRLGAPGAHEPREAHDFAVAHVHVDVLKHALPRKAPDLQRDVGDLGGQLRILVAQFPADHQRDQLLAVDLGDRQRPDVRAVAQHRNRVRDFEDLVHPVRDVDHRDAALLEVGDDVEQAFQLVFRKRRGGLVHDDQVRAEGQRLADFDDLLLRDAQAGDLLVDIQLDVQFVDQLLRLAPHGRPIHQARFRGLRPP